MTERERWIVYPLLFMALGFGLKNGIEIQTDHQDHQGIKSLDIETIRCHELTVLNASGKVVARMKVGSEGAGLIEAANPNGVWQAILTANSTNGVMGLMDHTGQPVLQIPPPAHSAPQSTDAKSREADPTAEPELKK